MLIADPSYGTGCIRIPIELEEVPVTNKTDAVIVEPDLVGSVDMWMWISMWTVKIFLTQH